MAKDTQNDPAKDDKDAEAKKAAEAEAKKAADAEAKKAAKAKADAEKAAESPRYRVQHPSPRKTSAVTELLGVTFEDGVAFVEDAKLAHQLTEYGCQIFEGETNTHALHTGTSVEQARINGAARWAFPN